jgi:hypothetical protein
MLVAQIFVCCLKIERDLFAYDECDKQPHNTYTEQLYSKTELCFRNIFSGFSLRDRYLNIEKIRNDSIPNRYFVLLLYDSYVCTFLKRQNINNPSTFEIVSILYRQNISHQSSGDEDLS